MKKVIAILFILIGKLGFATHMLGGYIALKHVSGYTYNVKYVSITSSSPFIQPDRCLQVIYFSDGDSIIVPRVNGPLGNGVCDSMMGEVIANGLKYNVYQGVKTFGNQGNFKAWTIDANRNDGIINIPGSVNVPFYCETFLRVFDPLQYCPVSTVDFGYFPLFKAAINNSFNSDLPIVFSEGDSITYLIDTCKTSFGNNIVGYSIPPGVSVHPSNGKFTITSPQVQGQFGFALRANKWRNGVLVSYTILDFGMDINASTINTVNLPITSNLMLNNDSIYVGNFATNDSIKISYNNSQQYQVNLYSEINSNLISQSNNGSITNLKILNLGNLERKQAYKITIRATDNPMTTNVSKDYIFYFTIGNSNPTNCALPQDLGGNEISKNEVIVFPNPVQNSLNFTKLPSNCSIQVYNLQGQMALDAQLKIAEVNLNELSKGLYFYKLTDISGHTIQSGKIIKD